MFFTIVVKTEEWNLSLDLAQIRHMTVQDLLLCTYYTWSVIVIASTKKNLCFQEEFT